MSDDAICLKKHEWKCVKLDVKILYEVDILSVVYCVYLILFNVP